MKSSSLSGLEFPMLYTRKGADERSGPRLSVGPSTAVGTRSQCLSLPYHVVDVGKIPIEVPPVIHVNGLVPHDGVREFKVRISGLPYGP
jgi:hypothetical protein